MNKRYFIQRVAGEAMAQMAVTAAGAGLDSSVLLESRAITAVDASEAVAAELEKRGHKFDQGAV